MSTLDRKTSVAIGLASVGVVWGVYQQVVPRVCDIRACTPGDTNLAAAEKAARWTSGAIVVGIALITRDATVFVMGGGAVVAFSWLHREANMVDPMSATLTPASPARSIHDLDTVGATSP